MTIIAKIKNAPCVRRDDSMFVAFCLYMVEWLGKPRFETIGGLVISFLFFDILLALTLSFNSLLPFEIFFGALAILVIPGIIGAIIRNKRLALFDKN